MTLVTPLPPGHDQAARRSVRPKHSASLIVVDRSGGEPKLLMGRRHASHRFMPDVFVFPGGRVDRADHRATFTESFDERMRRLLTAASARTPPRLPDALLACALREADEEAGLVFRDDRTGRYQAPGVRFVARAVTPSGLPRRFDTRFFMIDRSTALTEVSGRAGPDKELTELVWVSHAEALQQKISGITHTILVGIRSALLDPRDSRSVPFYRDLRGVRIMTPIEL